MTVVRDTQFYYGVVAVIVVEMCSFYNNRVKRTVVECFFLKQQFM